MQLMLKVSRIKNQEVKLVKVLFFILGSVVLFSTAQAQQTCFDSQPPQVKFSCENIGGDVTLQIEVLDVTNAAISKKSFGIDQNGADSYCEYQLGLLNSALKNKTIIQEAKLIALCENTTQPELLRIVLRPLPPYITVVDQKKMPDCSREMAEINKQP